MIEFPITPLYKSAEKPQLHLLQQLLLLLLLPLLLPPLLHLHSYKAGGDLLRLPKPLINLSDVFLLTKCVTVKIFLAQ